MNYPKPPSGMCPTELDAYRFYAIRFSVPVRDGELLLRSSLHVSPKALRLRGTGGLQQALVNDIALIVQCRSPVPFEAFADRLGAPGSPRTYSISKDDAIDDSSDGPPVDWATFGGDHHLRLQFVQDGEDEKVHVLLTVVAHGEWPKVSFRYADEEAWNTAQVVDYNTRRGEMESM